MVFFDGFDVTKELQYGYGIPDLAARGIGCLIVDGPGNGESVRFRNLPLIAETERYATPVYEYLAGRHRVRRQAHRRHGALAGRLLRAARRLARTALCLLRRLGRAMGLPRNLGAAVRGARFRKSAVAVGAARAFAMGARRSRPRVGDEETRRLPPRRHRAEDDLPVPPPARRRRRADSARASRRSVSPPSAPSERRSKCSRARKAASTIARSTTPPSASIPCSTGSPMCLSRADEERHYDDTSLGCWRRHGALGLFRRSAQAAHHRRSGRYRRHLDGVGRAHANARRTFRLHCARGAAGDSRQGAAEARWTAHPHRTGRRARRQGRAGARGPHQGDRSPLRLGLQRDPAARRRTAGRFQGERASSIFRSIARA